MKFAELKTVYNVLMSVKCRINNELAEVYNPRKHTGYYDFLLGNIEHSINEALKPIAREVHSNLEFPF